MDLLPFFPAAHLTLLAGTPPAAEQTDQFAEFIAARQNHGRRRLQRR